jgi:cobalt-zinc-cadmium efflux system outer membrane protein
MIGQAICGTSAEPISPGSASRGERMTRTGDAGAWLRAARFSLGFVFAFAPFGCSTPPTHPDFPEFLANTQPPSSPVSPPSGFDDAAMIQKARHEQPQVAQPSPPAEGGPDGGKALPKLKITLPMAVELCVTHNFRILAGAEQIKMVEADLITSSLIPNPTLFADYQLIPLQHADIKNQLGPPQWDALVTIPVDWLLFGKRLAAIHAARLGLEVSSADYADIFRVQVGQTVDAFYEVLENDAYFKLSEKHVEELTELEKLVDGLATEKKVSQTDVDRIKLAVHEAILERHDRELALDHSKARLRPYLGRTAADPDYEVEGSLTVTAMVPPPSLGDAVALADTHRPDLISGRKSIEQAKATLELERRRAKPQVAAQPGWSFQNQRYITGFRNGSMLDLGVSTTLPITDRNQGNIRRARASIAERQFTYSGDRADALAEVETRVADYSDSVEHLTLFNTPATLKAALDLRTSMEAAFRRGDRKLIELLDAQKAYQDRLAHVIEFESFYWRSLNRLNAAVGLKAYDPEKGPVQPVPK